MFGKRETGAGLPPALPPSNGAAQIAGHSMPQHIPDLRVPPPASAAAGGQPLASQPHVQPGASKPPGRRSENYYDIKSTIFNALIDAIDLTQLSQLDRERARDEIRDIVNEIITLKDGAMSIAE